MGTNSSHPPADGNTPRGSFSDDDNEGGVASSVRFINSDSGILIPITRTKFS